MADLLSDEVRRDPYPAYEEMRRAAPLLQDPRSSMWIVLDHAGVKRALSDHETFSSIVTTQGSQTPDWLVFLDPPRHTKLRAILMRAFTPRIVASLEPRIRELSRTLINATIERGEMDLVEDFAAPFPWMVVAEMLGIPSSGRPQFLRWSDVILGLSYTISGGEEAARAVRAHAAVKEEMMAYLRDLREERQRAPQDDLLTQLFGAEIDGERLTEEEIVGFFQLLLSAGTETTTNLISNAVLSFIAHPGELARLHAAPGLLPSAIEEILRYRSPVQMMFRTTRRAVEMHGQVIPAGQFVLPVIGAANRDPLHFREADRFDIARDPNPHLALGHGVHFCLGAALSRLEARIALADLLGRVKNVTRASDAPWTPRRALHVHGPSRLPIRFDPGARA
jgi:cytochrome P450